MKLNLALFAAVLTLTSTASAWHVKFYEHANFKGRLHERSGPGNPGAACQGAPNPVNNLVSSFKFQPYNAARTTKCCLELYNALDCKPSSQLGYHTACEYQEFKDLQYTTLQDKISSYRTVCRRV
ncbi:hypothetical protein BJY04DRAFT_212645 [Aspergillus karnatakaensis]|uniref:uncharacterized protein n=1 Tax=Aspergillus karnatakaensis TaxID=1810916 RepID=UPI003CCDBC5B